MSDQPSRPGDADELVWSPAQMIARFVGDEEPAGQLGRDGRLDEAAATLSRLEHEVDVLLSQLRTFEAAFARRASTDDE